MREVHSQLSITNQRGERNHGERNCAAILKFEVHHLVVADVVIALIHTSAIWSNFEGLCDILDIGNTIDQS